MAQEFCSSQAKDTGESHRPRRAPEQVLLVGSHHRHVEDSGFSPPRKVQ